MKDTFYFQHDCMAMQDEKIKKLMREFGHEGYGIFWDIIETLYLNANALQTDYAGIAYDMRIDESKLKSIINDFNLFVIKDGFFGSKSVERRLNERYEKSNKAKMAANSRWNNQPSDADELQAQCERIDSECDSNAIKVKESKLKEKKKKKKKKGESDIDYEKLMEYYNNKFKGELPSLTVMSKNRIKLVDAAINLYGKESIPKVFDAVCATDYAMGRTNLDWTADFDWIFQIDNFLKMYERSKKLEDSSITKPNIVD